MDQRVETLPALFLRAVAASADAPALHVFEGEAFCAVSWHELRVDVRRMAAALHGLGVKPGDRVVQISENRRQWLEVDLAVHYCQAVHVALHASLTGPQLVEQIADCEPVLVIVSTAAQAEKLAVVGSGLPAGVTVVAHDAHVPEIVGQPTCCLTDLAAAAEVDLGASLEQAALENLNAQSLATILYTSGTTGEPKGVMLSHGNLTSNAQACADAFAHDRNLLRLCWLPLSHIYARTSDLYTWLAAGSQMALGRSRDTLIADLSMVQPQFVNGVPYFYDKLYRFLRDAGMADQPGALVGLLGGKIRVCCAGGAALSDETARYFEQQGVLLVQGYGLTETSPVISTGTREAHRLGTVGRPLPGVEVRIADDGEILTRGPHVMQGYWRNPSATAEVLHDGWLATGDLGVLEDGYLRITGRKKELLVLSSGKNIAPALIERLLCDDPLVAQAMVVGDGRNYLAALLVPDAAGFERLVATRLPEATDRSPTEALRNHPAVLAAYQECISARLADLSPQEQIARFTLLGRSFRMEAGELTPTLKLRRAQIAEAFRAEIAALYANSPQTDAGRGLRLP